MSHIVLIQTQCRDPAALAAACVRLGLPAPTQGKVRLYSSEAQGHVVQLPNWRYPVVIDTATGKISFDNFGGAWGAQSELDRLLQAYAVAKLAIEARRKGQTFLEQALPDGSIRVLIQAGGETP